MCQPDYGDVAASADCKPGAKRTHALECLDVTELPEVFLLTNHCGEISLNADRNKAVG
jgi:hypothetical protein